MKPEDEIKAVPRIGSRKRVWQIVNGYGGLVCEFKGTKKQADQVASRAQAERTKRP